MGMHNNTCGGGVVSGGGSVGGGGGGGGGNMMAYSSHTPAVADDYYGGAGDGGGCGLVADYDLPQCLGGRPPLEPSYAAECGVYYEKNASAADYRTYYGGGDGAYDQLAVDVGGYHHHHHHHHHGGGGHHNHHPQSAEAAVIITSSDGLSYTNLDCNGVAAAVHLHGGGQADYGVYSDDGGGGYNGYGAGHRDDNVRGESYCGGGASVDNAFFNMHLNHNDHASTTVAGRLQPQQPVQQQQQQPRPSSTQPPPPSSVQSSVQTTAVTATQQQQPPLTPTSGTSDERCPRTIKQEVTTGVQCYGGGQDGSSPYNDDPSAYHVALGAGQQQQQHIQHQQQQHNHHHHHQHQQQQQQHHHHLHQSQQQQHCGRSSTGSQQKHGATTAAASAVQTAVPTYKWMQVKRNVPKPAGKFSRYNKSTLIYATVDFICDLV